MNFLRLPICVSTHCKQAGFMARNFASNKTGKNLINVPKVQIGEGDLLYLLVSIYIHGETLFSRTIVRARKGSDHTPLYYAVRSEMEKLGLCIKPLGGGLIKHDTQNKKIKIYGACKTFGPADHHATMEILKSWKEFETYKISVEK